MIDAALICIAYLRIFKNILNHRYQRIDDISNEMNDAFAHISFRQRHYYFGIRNLETSKFRNLNPISGQSQDPIPVPQIRQLQLSRHDMLQQNLRQKFFVLQQNVVVLPRISRYQFSESCFIRSENRKGAVVD